MENLDYNTVFEAAYEMLKDLDPVKAKADKNYLKKQEDKLFVDYFEEFIMSQKMNIQGHSKGQFDGKTLREIKNEFEYEHLTSRCCDQIKFAISYKLFSPIIKELHALKLDSKGSVKDSIIQQFTNLLDSPILESEHYCFVCGMNSKIGLTADGYSNFVDPNSRMARFSSHHACPYPQGIEQYSNVVKVPSGNLMFANDLRCLFPDADSRSDAYIIEKSGYYNSICSELGMLYNTEFWNKFGLVYVQVGNTSPQIVKNTKTGVVTVKINNTHDDDYEEKGEHHTVKKYISNEEYCGRISTSLWAVCAIDLDLMKSLCTQHGIDFETLSKECVQVSVEPGDYNVRSYNAARDGSKNTFFDVTKV
jgi:hypothetical protein